MSDISSNIEVLSETKGKIPNLPFVELAQEILEKDYFLSVNYVSLETMEKLSLEYKKESGHHNTLSFPLTETSGEIYMCAEKIKDESADFNRSPDEHLLFIYIHSLLHLKGFDHGKDMEDLENSYFKKFSTS